MNVDLPRADLIGRDDEMDRLGRRIRRVIAGSGHQVWVEGEPGIGKSALLEAALAEAGRLGLQVLAATADEFGRRVPLQVMLECLGVEPRSPDPARREIAELLGGEPGAASPDPVAAAAERLPALVDRLVAHAPLLLAVDDVQWADEASVRVLHRLSRLTRRLPLLLVVVGRPVPRRDDLVTFRRGLVASGAELITLDPLPDEAMTRLTGELAGAPAGAELRRAAERASGNPMYLRELVRALAREGLLRRHEETMELAPGEADVVPRSLATAISDRLGFLSAGTAEILRMAALLGPAFRVTDLSAIVGRSVMELAPALEDATAAGVLTESRVRFAFRHALVRRALYERTPAGLRLALHRQAALALAGAGPAAVEVVADQLLTVMRQPDADQRVDGWVVDWLLGAGGTLVRRAPIAAAELLGLAIDQLAADDARRDALETMLSPLLVLLGRREDAMVRAGRGLAATRVPSRAAEMNRALGWAMTDVGRPEKALTLLGRALRVADRRGAESAGLRAMLARAALADGEPERAEAVARRALDEAGRGGDHVAEAMALNVLGTAAAHRDDLEGAAAWFERGVSVAEPGGGPELDDLCLLLRQNRAYLLLLQERHAAADVAARELPTAAATAAAPRLATVRLLAAEVHYHAGRWDDALAEIDAAASHTGLMPVADRWWLHGLAAVIAIHRDDRAAACAHLDAAPPAPPAGALAGAEYVPLARALAAERDGRPQEALAILAAQLDHAGRRPAYQRRTWAPTLLRLAVTAGDSALARAAAEAGQADARPVHADDPRTGERTRARGRTATARRCRGLIEADHLVLAEAVDACRAVPRPLPLAETLEDAAVVLAQRGDLPAARDAYAEAGDLYTSLGAHADLLRADARLRRHGVHRRRRRRAAAVTGWDALTPAELTVARLVADGCANPDIAASLFLSRRTVEVHISHVLAKLGVRSRVDIAREAARRLPAPRRTPARTPPDLASCAVG